MSEAEAARFKERNATTGHRFAVTHWRSEMDSNRRSRSFRAQAAASCQFQFSVSADRRG